MKLYIDLFLTFFRIGSFTIGGGYAMIPLIEKEIVEKKEWIDRKDFVDMLALAQSAPGVIAVNTAIFVGYKIRGLRGALATTMGSIVPSFLIILLIAMFFVDIKDNAVVERIFKGIRPVVVALIAAPLYRMAKTAGITWKTIIIPIGVAVLIWQFGISPAIFILLGIVVGIIYGMLAHKKHFK